MSMETFEPYGAPAIDFSRMTLRVAVKNWLVLLDDVAEYDVDDRFAGFDGDDGGVAVVVEVVADVAGDVDRWDLVIRIRAIVGVSCLC